MAILLAPLAVIAAMATDLGLRRTGWPTVRMVAFVLAALWIETSGQVRILWSRVTQPVVRMNWTKRNQQLMRWWARRLVTDMDATSAPPSSRGRVASFIDAAPAWNGRPALPRG